MTGYQVERCQGRAARTSPRSPPRPATTYKDTTVSASTSYSYRVRAIDAAGNSAPTQTRPPLSTPTPTPRRRRSRGRWPRPWSRAARSISRGVRRRTTSVSPATGSSVARARAARTSPRSPPRPRRPTRTLAVTASHQLQLPGARHRRRRQPEPLHQHRDRHHPGAPTRRRRRARDVERRPWCPAVRSICRGVRRRTTSGLRLPDRALPGRGLLELRPDRDRDGDDLQRHWLQRVDQLQLPCARHRRRREPEPLHQHRHRHHAGGAGHGAAVTARDADATGLERRDRSVVGRVDGQRRCYRLPDRALPGAGCTHFAQIATASGRQLQGHQRQRVHQLQLPRPRHRRRRQPQPLHQQRERHHAGWSRPGLVAAYGFDEGLGSTVADASGNGKRRDDRECNVGGVREVREGVAVQWGRAQWSPFPTPRRCICQLG